MAQVTTRKRGKTWEYRFETASIDGKRKQTSKGGFRTKKEAQKAGAKALIEYDTSGKKFTPSSMSYADLLHEWFEKRCPLIYEQTTIDNYEKVIRIHLEPALGKYRISALDTVDFQNVINDKFKAGYALNRLSTFKNVMSLTMKYAKEMGYIKHNPMYEVKLPSKKVAKSNSNTRKKDRLPIPRDALARIFERFPEGNPSHVPMMISYKTGMRLGEVFALTWDDIDLENSTIDVNKQIQSKRGQGQNSIYYFKSCKYDSERTLPIDTELVHLLRRERLRQKENRLYYGEFYQRYYVGKDNIINQISGQEIWFVTVRESGQYHQPRAMQHTSKIIQGKALTKGDEKPIWEDFDFHSLRHTHGTELAAAGVPAKEIQIRMGHKNIETTLNVYVHDTPDMQNHTRETLEKIYQKAQ